MNANYNFETISQFNNVVDQILLIIVGVGLVYMLFSLPRIVEYFKEKNKIKEYSPYENTPQFKRLAELINHGIFGHVDEEEANETLRFELKYPYKVDPITNEKIYNTDDWEHTELIITIKKTKKKYRIRFSKLYDHDKRGDVFGARRRFEDRYLLFYDYKTNKFLGSYCVPHLGSWAMGESLY